MSAYVGAWRLWTGVPGAPSIKDAWGTFLNANATLLQAGAVGTVGVNINGLATYTLTVANGAADEARPLIQSYTGTLGADCTVTLPDVARPGWALNGTTGGKNVILTSGGGSKATVPADSRYWWYLADGAGAVTLPSVGFGGIRTSGNLVVGGTAAVTGTTAFTGAVTTAGGITANTNGITINAAAGLLSTKGHFTDTVEIDGTTTVVALTASGLIQSGGASGTNVSGWIMSPSGTASFGPSGYTYGILANGTNMLAGAYVAASDADLKSDIETISPKDGMAFVVSARPVVYRKRPRFDAPPETGVPETGFLAQEEVAAGRGDLVQLVPHESMPARPYLDLPAGVMLALPPQHGVAHLVAAMQAIVARLEALEARASDAA